MAGVHVAVEVEQRGGELVGCLQCRVVPDAGEVARTIAALQERGYVSREVDPSDARRKRLCVTQRGFDLLREGEAIFDDLRERWAAEIGPARLEELESDLTGLVGRHAVRVDAPGWMASDDLLEPTEPPPR